MQVRNIAVRFFYGVRELSLHSTCPQVLPWQAVEGHNASQLFAQAQSQMSRRTHFRSNIVLLRALRLLERCTKADSFLFAIAVPDRDCGRQHREDHIEYKKGSVVIRILAHSLQKSGFTWTLYSYCGLNLE